MHVLHQHFLILILVYSQILPVKGVTSVPGLQSGCEFVYYKPGDVNFGFFSVRSQAAE